MSSHSKGRSTRVPSTSTAGRPAVNSEPDSSQTRRRVTIVAACNGCRTRKARVSTLPSRQPVIHRDRLFTTPQCSGERPRCSQCAKRDVDCQYSTTTSEETHSQAQKRKLGELETQTATYLELFDIMQHGTEEDSLTVYRRIRAGANPQPPLTGTAPEDYASRSSPVDDDSSRFSERPATALLQALASRTDSESSMLLARLRIGEAWEDIAGSIVPPNPVLDSPASR